MLSLTLSFINNLSTRPTTVTKNRRNAQRRLRLSKNIPPVDKFVQYEASSDDDDLPPAASMATM